MTIRHSKPSDTAGISALLRDAFGGPGEAALVTALRSAGDMAHEFVAVSDDGGALIGHVALSRHIAPAGWLCLAPLAVVSGHRGKGVGAALVERALEAARADGAGAVSVLGDPAHYQRFGFTHAAATALQSRYQSPHLMILPLSADAGGRAGPLVHAAAFDGL